MILELQIQLGQSIQSSHLINSEKPVWNIGRDRHADINLEGDRVAESHATLILENEHWRIDSDQGQLRVAGNYSDSIEITHGQIVSIGPYLLKFRIIDSAPPELDESKQINLQDQSLEIKHPRITSNRFKPKINFKQFIGLDSVNKSKTATQKLVGKKPVNKRLVVLVLLVIIVWSFVALKSCESDDQQAITKTTKTTTDNVSAEDSIPAADTKNELTLDEKRIANRYIQWSQQLYQQGELEQAYLRLQAGHQKIPAHAGLEFELQKLREELIELYRSSGNIKEALRLLEPIKNTNQIYTVLYDDLFSQQKSIEKLSETVKSATLMLNQILPEYQKLLSANEFNKARQLLATMDAATVNLDSNLKQQYDSLIETTDKAQQDFQDHVAQIQALQQASIEDNQIIFFDCLEYIESGDFKSAYDTCRKVKEDVAGGYDTAEVKVWLEFLEDKRFVNSRLLLESAERCYNDGDFKCAFENWESAFTEDEVDIEANEKYMQALAYQIKVAQNLFKTAKAYEDLGQIEQAKSELKELIEQLPLTNQPLYKKANELLVLLEQY